MKENRKGRDRRGNRGEELGKEWKRGRGRK